MFLTTIPAKFYSNPKCWIKDAYGDNIMQDSSPDSCSLGVRVLCVSMSALITDNDNKC
jgi:hypothetical protein